MVTRSDGTLIGPFFASDLPSWTVSSVSSTIRLLAQSSDATVGLPLCWKVKGSRPLPGVRCR